MWSQFSKCVVLCPAFLVLLFVGLHTLLVDFDDAALLDSREELEDMLSVISHCKT